MIPLEYNIAVDQYEAAISAWVVNGQVMTQSLSERILFWRRLLWPTSSYLVRVDE